MAQFTQKSCTCPVHCPEQAAERKAIFEKLGAVHGLLTVAPPDGWQPKTAASVPPGIIPTIFHIGMQEEFALLFNESEWAARRHKWAVITTNGQLLIVNVPDADRPARPDLFPGAAEVIEASTLESVAAMAELRNAPRHEVAAVPRQWTLPIRSLTPTWLKRQERLAAGAMAPAAEETFGFR